MVTGIIYADGCISRFNSLPIVIEFHGFGSLSITISISKPQRAPATNTDATAVRRLAVASMHGADLHILWNTHLLKDLGPNIINGIRPLDVQPNSLSCPRTTITRMKFCVIFSSANRGGRRLSLRIPGSGVLCLVLNRKPSVRRIWKRILGGCDGACMLSCCLWGSGALIELVIRNVDQDPVRGYD